MIQIISYFLINLSTWSLPSLSYKYVIELGLQQCYEIVVFWMHSSSLRVMLPQSCLILCDPMDCSPPGSSVHGTLQTRILEWVAMLSSRGSSWPSNKLRSLKSPALVGGLFILAPPGKPIWVLYKNLIQQISLWAVTVYLSLFQLTDFSNTTWRHMSKIWCFISKTFSIIRVN